MIPNLVASRHIKKEEASFPIDVRRSKTPLFKLTKLKDLPWIDFVEKIQHELHAYDIHNERKDSGQLKQKEYPSYKGHHIWSRKIIKKNLLK